VHYFLGVETALPSKKDDCRAILADFGKNQFFIGNINKHSKNIY